MKSARRIFGQASPVPTLQMKSVSKFRAGFTCPYIEDEIVRKNFRAGFACPYIPCQSSPAFQCWEGRAKNAEPMKFGLT